MQACLSRPFARAPMSFTCCLLSLGLSLVTHCSKFSSAARGYRLWRLLAQVFFSTRGCAAKGSQFVQKVRLTALSLQCSSAPPSVLAGRSCAHFADAGVPGLSCCCCALRPALRCRSCARCPSRWAIALRRHVRSCSPRAVHRTHPLDPACAGLDERGYPTRCGGSSGMQILPRTQCLQLSERVLSRSSGLIGVF